MTLDAIRIVRSQIKGTHMNEHRTAIALLAMACSISSGAHAQQATIGSGGVGCKVYETLDRILAFANAGKHDLGDKFIGTQYRSGQCRNLEGNSVIILKRGWKYTQVMNDDGSDWWVLENSVKSSR